MPQVFWRHVCAGRDVLRTSPLCRVCGCPGVFDGWRLKWWEGLSVYYYVYGLNPMGSHREVADRVFAGMRDLCVRCGGRAVLTVGDGSAWRVCPDCEGTGGVWNRPLEEVDAARRQVLAQCPGSYTQQPPPFTQPPAMRARPAKPVPAQDQGAGDGRATSAGSWTEAEPAWEPPQPVRRPRTRPRQSGHSSHGLSFADVQRAFAEAERLLGTQWRLKGRRHCRRVSIDPRYATYAMNGAARSWAWVTTRTRRSPRRLMPLPIVWKAAEILDVPVQLLICREW